MAIFLHSGWVVPHVRAKIKRAIWGLRHASRALSKCKVNSTCTRTHEGNSLTREARKFKAVSARHDILPFNKTRHGYLVPVP